jgi:ADP-ribosylglycohydrolase
MSFFPEQLRWLRMEYYGWSLEELGRRTLREPLPSERIEELEAGAPCALKELEQLMEGLNVPARAQLSLWNAWVPAHDDVDRGERLRGWRTSYRPHGSDPPSSGLTLSELSDRTQAPVAATTIRRIESGQALPTERLVSRLVRALRPPGPLADALLAWSRLATGRRWPHAGGPEHGSDWMGRVFEDSACVVAFVQSSAGSIVELADLKRQSRSKQKPYVKHPTGDRTGDRWREEVRRRRLSSEMNIPSLARITESSLVSGGVIDRVEALLWGTAIGDAMNPGGSRMAVESSDGGNSLRASTDTQLFFETIEMLLEEPEFTPGALIERLGQHPVPGLGSTQRKAIAEYKRYGDWSRCGFRSAGCGAVHRVLPLMLNLLGRRAPDSDDDWEELQRSTWEEIVAATLLTHDDDVAVACSVAMCGLLWTVLADPVSFAPRDKRRPWLSTFRSFLGEFPQRQLTARLGSGLRDGLSTDGGSGTITLLETLNDLEEQLERGTELNVLLERYGTGTYLLELVPSMLATLECLGDCPRDAIRVSAASWNAETQTSLVAMMLAARDGEAVFEADWLERLERQFRPPGRAVADELTRTITSFTARLKGAGDMPASPMEPDGQDG